MTIQYVALNGKFNALCESQFIALERHKFPPLGFYQNTITGGSVSNKFLVARPCLLPVTPTGTGTA